MKKFVARFRCLALFCAKQFLASAAAFGDAEEQAFAIFDAYAQDTRRSTIDCLDRGLQMLANLKVARHYFVQNRPLGHMRSIGFYWTDGQFDVHN